MSNFTNSKFASSAMGINITIIPTEASNRAGMEYLIWIDFDHNSTAVNSSSGRISVFVEEASRPKPEQPVIYKDINISEFTSLQGCFFSSIGQLSRIHALIVTFDDLRSPYDQQVRRTLSRLATILASVFGSLGGGAVLAAVVAWWYINSSYRRWKKELDQLAKSMQSLPGVPLKISFADISKATSNFHETMKLGTGAFGAFTRSDTRCYEDFLAEVSIINRLRHKNIVPLVGWSYHKGEPLLVYEYMPNGSLDRHLFPRARNSLQHNSSLIRQWDTRYNIVSDIATGLHYVHHEYEPKVLHRDIKASNILVDSTFRARLGDFGLACTLAVNRNSISGDVAGTFGYIAPDYAINELQGHAAYRRLCVWGAGCYWQEGNDERYAIWPSLTGGRILEAVDNTLSDTGHGEFKAEEARRLLLLGLACSNPNPSDRPTMVDAVQIIAKSAPAPVVPLEKPRVVCFPPLPLPRGSLSESTDYYDTVKGSLQIERSMV
uniref:Protein kinase domain-containing protein n=1 Tax=Leersia perrieri TaxID=77586 RepID=A0A0D9XIP1_9ORYZ